MRKLKLFISQPMHGLDDDEIREQRKLLYELTCIIVYDWTYLTKYNFKLINQFDIKDPPNFEKNHPDIKSQRIYRLGRSIRLMADASLVVFYGDWQSSKGCLVERAVCDEYHIPNLDSFDIVKYCKEHMDNNPRIEYLFEKLYKKEYDECFEITDPFTRTDSDDE